MHSSTRWFSERATQRGEQRTAAQRHWRSGIILDSDGPWHGATVPLYVVAGWLLCILCRSAHSILLPLFRGCVRMRRYGEVDEV